MNRILTIGVGLIFAAIAFADSPPALQPPDGKSHRGDKMVGDQLTDPKDIAALGKLYREAKDFEIRQEYFLRLLDYFWFSKERLIGMKQTDIEEVFGPGKAEKYFHDQTPNITSLLWSGGRDYIQVSFKDGKATGAAYVMGF